MEKFDGDTLKFRGWKFDLLVTSGQVDENLAEGLKLMLKVAVDEKWDEKWNPLTDLSFRELKGESGQEYHSKYLGELYGLIFGLIIREAKGVVKGIVDRGFVQDGFKALLDLNRRYDTPTAATLLQSYLEAVNPPAIKGMNEVISGIHKWESKVAVLRSRYDEDLKKNLKLDYTIYLKN